MTDHRAFWQVVSWLCGWSYFTAWSLSFYPQAILNIRRSSTEGFSVDFPLLNILGFTCYVVSTAVFLYSPVVRGQYAARHPTAPEPTVRVNDLVFGVHALLLCFITYSQFYPRLWGWVHDKKARPGPGRLTLVLFWGSILSVLIAMIVVSAGGKASDSDAGSLGWLDVIYTLGYVKIVLTIFKYLPQVVHSAQRRSTSGFAVEGPLYDLAGGILSLLQLIIDSTLQGNWSGVTGNPLKFGLANVSIVFDLIFMAQHYIIYGPVEDVIEPIDVEDGADGEVHDPQEAEGERRPLLDGRS